MEEITAKRRASEAIFLFLFLYRFRIDLLSREVKACSRRLSGCFTLSQVVASIYIIEEIIRCSVIL